MERDNIQQDDYEGFRMRKLRAALKKALENFFSKLPAKKYRECFTSSGLTSNDIPTAYNSFIENLKEAIENEFEYICAEKNVKEKLNELDDLIQQQQFESKLLISPEAEEFLEESENVNNIKCLPLPDEDPKTLIQKRREEIKRAEIERMRTILEQLEQENQQLRENIIEYQKVKKSTESEVSSKADIIHKAFVTHETIWDKSGVGHGIKRSVDEIQTSWLDQL